MTMPEHLTHFWGPVGTTTPFDKITVDLRPGGAFETVMVSDADDSEYSMRATYVEVEPPAKLVWTEADVEGGMTTTVTFVDLGDGRTEVITHQTNVPAMYRTPGVLEGFASSLDRLRRLPHYPWGEGESMMRHHHATHPAAGGTLPASAAR